MANIHDGHRKRMRDRFIEVGFDGFNSVNVLEMLLFYSQGRKDTNELAHKLLDEFHTLPAIFEADFEKLMSIEGIGENTAVLLKLIPEISRRYMEELALPKKTLKKISDAGKYFAAKFMYEADETAFALFLDNGDRVISCQRLSKGIVNATDLSIRMLVELAVKYKSAKVILAHNHPHGMPIPSMEDEVTNSEVNKALRMVNIKLVDHFVVSGDLYYSFKDTGLM